MLIEELLDIIKGRRSVRTFTPEPVSEEEIRLLLEAARYAPSNSNRQAWKFLVVQNNSVKNDMVAAVKSKAAEIRSALSDPDLIKSFDDYADYLTFFQNAPAVIIALVKRSSSFLENLALKLNLKLVDHKFSPELMSISMAIQNIQLAAHTLGLGSCCMTGPLLAAEEIKQILDVRPPFEMAALIPVGRYKQTPPAPPRKDLGTISEMIK